MGPERSADSYNHSFKHMDQGTKKILEFILGKNEGQITDEDRAFLLARRSYVSSQDFERLGINLSEELAKRESGSETKSEKEVPKEVSDVASKKKEPLSKMNKEELLAEAKARGVDVPEGSTNDEIRSLLQ